ncbi:MAG: ArnT family glycosyltransferase [Candidatus Binatia bacterium]
MLKTAQSSLWLTKLFPALALALFYAFCALALRPFENLPFIDDWTYAWSVEQWLRTGELRFSDWSIHYPIVQVLWGALFCLPFGFSFSALRVSTVVLAWLGALAFYAMMRELGRSGAHSLIATFLLLVNPVFFILTFSYMTDVPFVSLANISLLFFVRSITRKRKIDSWLGSFFALCAFLTRQLAVAIPIALVAYFLVSSYERRLAHFLPAALSLLFMLFTPLWISYVFGFTKVYAGKLDSIQFWFDVSPFAYASAVMGVLAHISLALSPMALPFFFKNHKPLLWMTVLSLLIVGTTLWVVTGTVILPLEKGSTWALEELGATLPLLGGARPPREGMGMRPFLPLWLNYPLAVLSLCSAAVIIARAIELAREKGEKVELLFFIYALFQTALILLLWLFYDRYYVVLLCPLMVLLVDKRLADMKFAVFGIAMLFLISLSGTSDSLQVSRATNEAITWLREKGVALADIDASYAFNGWNLYFHPDPLGPGEAPDHDVRHITADDVRAVTGDVEKPYEIAVTPLPGYHVLREIRWSPSFWMATDRIYILKK